LTCHTKHFCVCYRRKPPRACTKECSCWTEEGLCQNPLGQPKTDDGTSRLDMAKDEKRCHDRQCHDARCSCLNHSLACDDSCGCFLRGCTNMYGTSVEKPAKRIGMVTKEIEEPFLVQQSGDDLITRRKHKKPVVAKQEESANEAEEPEELPKKNLRKRKFVNYRE